MSEHRGTSFFHSCVKVPVDPCSRQPTPSYERPRSNKDALEATERCRKINFAAGSRAAEPEAASPAGSLENLLDFLESIPDYGQVNHLSNERFKQKVEHLRRRQRLILRNLSGVPEVGQKVDTVAGRAELADSKRRIGKNASDLGDLKLNGRRCCLEESRTSSPILFPSGSFASLAEDQDLLAYRDKERKTMRNNEILSAGTGKRESWSTWSVSRSTGSVDSANSDDSSNSEHDSEPENELENAETRSLPADSPREWQPTVPKPFSFTLREDAEKYMTEAEEEAEEEARKGTGSVRRSSRRRHAHPVPIASKIPLYDKLIAEKEARSRTVREESALNLLSQVRPFRLECDRRAWRSLAKSSPEVRGPTATSGSRFRAKPVPKDLFSTDVYDRMLEDEYFRQLQKKIRAAELMKSSCLPPSMARRERVKAYSRGSAKKPDDRVSGSAVLRSETARKESGSTESRESSRTTNLTPVKLHAERSRSAGATPLPSSGTNLAAILRCQASRQRLERELTERMEEKRREQAARTRESMIGRKPVWRALRSAARHEHETDLDIRSAIRRDEAREQAERHRLQMEMMLDRVTRIPTLFERHSQTLSKMQSRAKNSTRARKKRSRRKDCGSSGDSSGSCNSASNSRPTSGSLTSSPGTPARASRSSKSSGSSKSSKESKQSKRSNESNEFGSSESSKRSSSKSSESKSRKNSSSKKKSERGPLKVSINETAELIEDKIEDKSFDEGSSSENENEDEEIADE